MTATGLVGVPDPSRLFLADRPAVPGSVVVPAMDGRRPLLVEVQSLTVHYTYGGDLAKGIVTAMEHPDARNDDFNLSTATSTTVLELAELIWRKCKGPGVPFNYVSDDPFEHDVQRRIRLPTRRSACWASRRPRPSTRSSTRSSPGSRRRSPPARF